MGEDGGVGQPSKQDGLDVLGHVVPALHGPGARDEHVHLYERALAGLARAQHVKRDAASFELGERIPDSASSNATRRAHAL